MENDKACQSPGPVSRLMYLNLKQMLNIQAARAQLVPTPPRFAGYGREESCIHPTSHQESRKL